MNKFVNQKVLPKEEVQNGLNHDGIIVSHEESIRGPPKSSVTL